MAKKKKESEFDKLARLIKDESEDIRDELGGRIDGVRAEMKSGFARIDQELASIRAELRSIRSEIADLQKEIGHPLKGTAVCA